MKKRFFFFILMSGVLMNAFAQKAPTNSIYFDCIVPLKGRPMNFNGRTATYDNPETKLLFRHGKIVLRNKNEELKVFDVKSRELVFKLGMWSFREQADFYNPHLFAPMEDSLLCYIEDGGFIYEADCRGAVRKTKLRSYSYDFEFGGNLVGIISDFVKMKGNGILFAGYSKKYGKNLFLTCNEGGKAETKELDYPLNLDTKAMDSFVPYHGAFSVRPDRKRGVYAYRYYPVVRILDLEKGGMKTLRQEGKGFDFSTLEKADCETYNAIYCFGCYAGEKYIYVLQAAGSLFDQLDKGSPVYVEQYDWEGNPIQKMKLDRAGHAFCVDEAHGKIYLAERFNAKTSQIFEYDIPGME